MEASDLTFKSGQVYAKNSLKPIAKFQSASLGAVNVIPGHDNITRQVPISIIISEGKIDNFGVAVLKKFKGIDFSEIPAENGLFRINFTGPPDSFKSFSFVDVLEDKIDSKTFENKIVLIGATSPDLHDTQIVPTSYGKSMSGIEVHANVIQTILNKKYLVEEGQKETVMAIFILSFLAFLSMQRIFFGLFLVPILIFTYFIYSIFSFDQGVIRNLIFPPLGALITSVLVVIYQYLEESLQRRFIRKAFSYYLSDKVIEEITKNPENLRLSGARKEITVLFSDIAGFTSFSEKVEPETLHKILNEYFTSMTEVVFRNDGVLDKYIGDSVMAFWGAPVPSKNHAYLACKTALEMLDKSREHKFDIRIGINTGEMIVGNMGSDQRFNFIKLCDISKA